MNKNYYCIIMAGGTGTRFWPVSRAARPKQFLDILGLGKTFLRMNFYRYSQIVPIENIIVVTSEQYAGLVRSQIPQLLEENLLLEPSKRNTAPCVAYATYKILKRNPDAVAIIAPSDHNLSGIENFRDTMSCALDYASKNDALLTIGVQPDHPDTNYGYIQADMKDKTDVGGHCVYRVKTFTEKPDEALARVFLKTGEFFWNSGMFIWNLKSFRSELESCLPEVAAVFRAGTDVYDTPREEQFIRQAYTDCPAISIDYGVMEKTRKAKVFMANFGWSDVGTWTSIFEHSQRSEEGNNLVAAAESMVSGVKDSIIREDNEGKIVVVRGLENFLVIDTPDALMICPKDDAVVKEIVADLSINDKSKFL
ncbi:MAG: mannose-1-phosphate guanylyltransferase [Bacteroidales bacterium]|nr:mannose-1-phosphate guanylyltransferase [Bacteroidales bacterium]